MLAVLVLILVSSLLFGSKTIALSSVLNAFLHYRGSTNDIIVRSLHVPRTLLGLTIGMSLGLAGAVMQGVTRNPLADPGILGVNAGASLAIVLAVFSLKIVSPAGYVWFAFAGAAVASALVYGLASRSRQGATPVTLALAGAATSAFLLGLSNAILLTDSAVFSTYRFWAVGSLSGRTVQVLLDLLPFLVVGSVLAIVLGPALNVLSLGDDAARSLGQRVGRTRALAAVSVLLLVGAAVSAVGPIAFVGLMVPHMARSIVGRDYRWVMPYSAVLGAILLVGSDVIGRLIARPAEVDVAVVTAILGTPFFIVLVRRSRISEL